MIVSDSMPKEESRDDGRNRQNGKRDPRRKGSGKGQLYPFERK